MNNYEIRWNSQSMAIWQVPEFFGQQLTSHYWLVVLTILKNISQWEGLYGKKNMFETTNHITTLHTSVFSVWHTVALAHETLRVESGRSERCHVVVTFPRGYSSRSRFNLAGGWVDPSEKYESRWEGWHPIYYDYYGKKMFETTKQQLSFIAEGSKTTTLDDKK